ncbi:recombinase family protein, partial [Candidatus Micrarchaeota archaeon]|nr:recombinase family protein [Candidatus Micrarchaeota archaeon]
MMSIAFGQSKYYIDNLSENIKRGIRQKLRNGIWPTWTPLGYINNKNNHCIVVDRKKAKYIKKAFEIYSTGKYPLAQIRKIINSLGLVSKKGKTLSVSSYQYMLKNPIYYGIIRYNNEFYSGKHEPIITKKLFDKCQKVMKQKSKPNGKGLKPYIYRGFFRCGECGCFITTETQKEHNYLRCTKRKNSCSQRYTREEVITSQIKKEIKKVSLSSAWVNASITKLEKEKSEITQAESSFAQKMQDEFVGIETKLDRLLDLQLDGNLSQTEYTTKKQKLILAKK